MNKIKKRIVSTLIATFLIISFSEGYASAATSQSANLNFGTKIAVSPSVYFGANQNIIFSGINYSDSGSPIVITLSKSGEGSKVSMYVGKHSSESTTIKNPWGSGNFYISMQCGNTTPLNTNCRARGTITNNN